MAFKRKVFYLSGFDPRGARFYHTLHAEACARLARITGEEITVSDREKGEGTLAHWRTENAAQHASTDITFLGWDDIVRRAWVRNPWELLRRCVELYTDYARHFRWAQLFRMAWAPLVTLLYPPLCVVLIPLLLAAVLHASFGHAWLSAAGGLLGGAWLLHRMKSFWLLRFFIFNHRSYIAPNPDLTARAEIFARHIAEALKHEAADEILLVCHSNGTLYCMEVLPALAEIVEREMGGIWPAHFRVLTYGHCVPLLSMLPHAHRFHAGMARVAALPLSWVDVGFPGDGACYANSNPFLPDYPQHAVRLQTSSARFFKFYHRARYLRLRRNKFALHFAYLDTGDRYSPLAFPALTASKAPLPELLHQFRNLP